MNTISFKINGIQCVACTKLAERFMRNINGVSSAIVDLQGNVEIQYGKGFSWDKFVNEISKTEYKLSEETNEKNSN